LELKLHYQPSISSTIYTHKKLPKSLADFNVMIAIVTKNYLFATDESNAVEGETFRSLHQFIGTFKVFCINAKKSENYKNNKIVQKVLKLVSTYLF